MAKTNLAALKKIKADKGTKTTEQFALDLLRKTADFGNAEQLDKTKVIPSGDPVSEYLPNSVFYWAQTKERSYQTLLIELDKSAKELFKIPAFNQKDNLLDILEDVLARISQLTLNGFAKVRARDASTKWGKQTETLVVLAVKDDHSDEKNTQHLVSFATVSEQKDSEESLDIFYVREFSEISDPTAKAKQNALLKKRHFDLLNSAKWKDAFVTVKERKSAENLLECCRKENPNNDEIINSCVDLLQNMASGYLRGQHNQTLNRIRLPSEHEIGHADNSLQISPLQGEAIRDQKDRLLGYIVYCVDTKTSAADIREFMESNNHFHNVLIIYPDTENPTVELWQGKKRLEGKLIKDKTQFSGESKLVSVLTRFFAISSSNIKNPEQLAKELAFRARYLKQVASDQLRKESDAENSGDMLKLYSDFRSSLIHTITESEFADAYAQTLTYGLLSARWIMAEDVFEKLDKGDESAADLHFSRRNALDYLPTSSGFLKEFFNEVLKNTPDDGKVAWILGDIADLLDKTHIQYVFGEGDVGAPDADPIIHFYEPFLNAYDSEERQRRGVYYTPQPVVNFIVRNVDQELKISFGLEDGLADTSTWQEVIKANPQIKLPNGVDEKDLFIKLLDPATGTGTFLVAVIDQIFKNLESKWIAQGKDASERSKLWNKYVDTHLVKKLYGFEVMMASYAIAHLKISLKLRQTDYRLHSKTTFNVLLTNTLEGVVEQTNMEATAIAEEAERARDVKRNSCFTVVIGNPPYSGHSANKSGHINDLLQEYKEEPDGGPLQERNPKWINDDYVKFIRFSQIEISKAGVGILSFITNHSWLDNPTFRGVRASLLKDYDSISTLDLHGNSTRQEFPPEGAVDENIFDIKQGVAVFMFVKSLKNKNVDWKNRVVSCGDIWGSRLEKYKKLELVNKSMYSSFLPMKNLYVLRQQDNNLAEEFAQGWSIKDIYPVSVLGFQTHRDKLAISFSLESMNKIVTELISDEGDNVLRSKYAVKDSATWQLSLARKMIRKIDNVDSLIANCTYRPFDNRFWFFGSELTDRPRRELLSHVINETNLSLLLPRQIGSQNWNHFFVANFASNDCVVSNKSKEANYVFPLYLNKSKLANRNDTRDLLGNEEGVSEIYSPNIDENFVLNVANLLGLEFNSECEAYWGEEDFSCNSHEFNAYSIACYITAVLSSKVYSSRYGENLRSDYPRVKFTGDIELFQSLVLLGHKLIRVYLMTDSEIEVSGKISVFVDTPKYVSSEGRVYINNEFYVDGVSEDEWNFEIGVYKVLQKWLKDRYGETLSEKDISNYKGSISSIRKIIPLIADTAAYVSALIAES